MVSSNVYWRKEDAHNLVPAHLLSHNAINGSSPIFEPSFDPNVVCTFVPQDGYPCLSRSAARLKYSTDTEFMVVSGRKSVSMGCCSEHIHLLHKIERCWCIEGVAIETEDVKKDAIVKDPIELSGLVASPGVVSGRGLVWSGRNREVREGDIIVTKMTTPAIISVIDRIAGIVTSEGGLTSHAAVIARHYGIPTVVSCKGIVEKLEYNFDKDPAPLISITTNGEAGKVIIRQTGEIHDN